MVEITTELIQHILQETQDSAEIARRIERYHKIYTDLRKLDDKIRLENARHQTVLQEISGEKVRIHLSCDHPQIEHYSAQYDSFSECQICRKEIK